MFAIIMYMVRSQRSDKKSLYEFEKQGISFEMIIENCVRELENNTKLLAYHINTSPPIRKINNRSDKITLKRIIAFTAGEEGMKLAGRYIEMIRSCNNWEDLYDQMLPTSEFWKEMNDRIHAEFKQCGILCRFCKLLLFRCRKS